MKKKLLVPIAVLLLGANPAFPSIAQDTGGAQVAAQSRTLEGGVQKIDLSLEHLRDVGLDLKEIMTSSRHLYDEVTLQPVAMVTQPSMIGPGTIINIPVGTRPVGTVQQPRKKRVDMAMNNMTPIIQMFKQNADEFVADQRQLDVSDAAKEQLKPLIGDWISNVNKISSELDQLQSLTQGPKYENASIASVCSDMQQTAQAMEKVRNKAFKIMKKENQK